MSAANPAVTLTRDRLDIVVVGHVDHGKSTVIGRLMADTGSLPEGKLDQVRTMCARNARPFEYAFLLDALRDERAQGITIDTARCFFGTAKRDYIIHDAPGHVEFLKNMVTGASRAQAALLLIDAHEGVRENSKLHGCILSLLGIRQVAVLVNKMDLVGWREEAYQAVRDEYAAFLGHFGVRPPAFVPLAARPGANIARRATEMPWYAGPTVLELLDAFASGENDADRPFRMPVQDVYKFTAAGDDRRIVAGTVETGEVTVGDDVAFLPSGKRSRVATIEVLCGPAPDRACAEQAVGFTLEPQVYVRPGELMVRSGQTAPSTGRRFAANVFWMSEAPLVSSRRYGLKLGAARVPVELVGVRGVLDASDLTGVTGKRQLDRHDVGECIFEAARPVAFDVAEEIADTARFVVVDGYDIAGCGVILAEERSERPLVAERSMRRERTWTRGDVRATERLARYGHSGKAVVVVGAAADGALELARRLERRLFERGAQAYFLGPNEAFAIEPGRGTAGALRRDEDVRQLGELARVMTDAGLLFVTAIDGADADELETLRALNAPGDLFVVAVGASPDADDRVDVALPAHPEPDAALDVVEARLGAIGVLTDYAI